MKIFETENNVTERRGLGKPSFVVQQVSDSR